MAGSHFSKKTLYIPLSLLSLYCLSPFLFHFSPGAQPRVISIPFYHFNHSSLKKRRVQKSLREGTFGTLPPVLPGSPAVSAWHTFPVTSVTETSRDALWHKSIWNQMGLFPLLWLGGLMVQSGLDSYIEEPEGVESCFSRCTKYYSLRCRRNIFFLFLLDVHPWPRF